MNTKDEALRQRITDYLASGGLWNPELANHDAVRDLLIECREALAQPAAQVPASIRCSTVITAICAVDREAARRGEMFPQTSDERAEDRAAVRCVIGMLDWYEKNTGCGKIKDWPLAVAPAQPAPAAMRQGQIIGAAGGASMMSCGCSSYSDGINPTRNVKCAAHAQPAPRVPGTDYDPIENFSEGQWWLVELDGMANVGTDDQKRAVAVVRNLLRAAKAAQPAVQVPEGNYVQPVPDHCDRIIWRGKYWHLKCL